MKGQSSQGVKEGPTLPARAGRGPQLRFQELIFLSVGVIQCFPPEGSLTWARWPGSGYKSPSALPEETVSLLAGGLACTEWAPSRLSAA